MTAEPALPDGVHLFTDQVSVHLTHETRSETDEHTEALTHGTDSPEDKKQSQCHMQHVQKNRRLHGTLCKILHLCPKGKSEIFPVLASSFPFKLAPISKQISYVKQCLIVLRYVPMMEQQFLHLCMDRCLEIDVEIRIANNGMVRIQDEEGEGIADLDRNGLDDGKAMEEELKQLEKKKTQEQKVDEMAEKVSCGMKHYVVRFCLLILAENILRTFTGIFFSIA